MRVGLVRHFPVREPMPSGWLTAGQLHEWRLRYDASEALRMEASLDAGGWVRCYCSDLKRAVATAKAMYPGEAIATPLLREPELGPFRKGGLPLPYPLWRWVLRMAWMSGHRSLRGPRDEFLERVAAVANLIESAETDILLFSHAGMMAFLRSELVRRGFVGPKYRVAEHGRLYVFGRSPVATASN